MSAMSGAPMTALENGSLNRSVFDLLSVMVICRTGAPSTTCAEAGGQNQEQAKLAVIMAPTVKRHRRPTRPAGCRPRLADDVGRPSCVTAKSSALRLFAARPWLYALALRCGATDHYDPFHWVQSTLPHGSPFDARSTNFELWLSKTRLLVAVALPGSTLSAASNFARALFNSPRSI